MKTPQRSGPNLWAVDRLVEVKRPGGAGRRLDVLVRWEGAWRDSWRSVTDLTTDMRKRARVMEREAHAGDKRGRERDEPEEGSGQRPERRGPGRGSRSPRTCRSENK